MNKKSVWNLLKPLILIVVTAAVAVCGTALYLQGSLDFSIKRRNLNAKAGAIYYRIENNFFEEVDSDDIIAGVARGMVDALDDPYSNYMTPEEYKGTKLSDEGQAVGIGISVTLHPDLNLIYVYSVVEAGNAYKAGIRKGDMIIAVNGEAVTKKNYSASVKSIQGEAGTKVTLTVKSGDTESDIEVERGQFASPSVFYRMIGDIGYCKITGFDYSTYDQFKTAMDDLIPGAKGLLFDVRDNHGGMVDTTADILDYLLPECDTISVEYKDGLVEIMHKSDADCVDLPMAVLQNGSSASAAELFSAALRDVVKAPLIGNKSFGKGIMQRTYEFLDGSALKITVAHFNPPSGVNFHGEGLHPDTEVEYNDEQSKYWFLLDDTTDPYILEGVKQLSEK